MITRPPIFSTPKAEILDFHRRTPEDSIGLICRSERHQRVRAHLHSHGVFDGVALFWRRLRLNANGRRPDERRNQAAQAS